MKYCTACDLCIRAKNQMQIDLSKVKNHKILFLTDSPRYREDKLGVEFNSDDYKYFFELLKNCFNLYREDYIVAHAIRCKLPSVIDFKSTAINCMNNNDILNSVTKDVKLLVTLGNEVTSIFFEDYTYKFYEAYKFQDWVIIPINHPIYIRKNHHVIPKIKALNKFFKRYV